MKFGMAMAAMIRMTAIAISSSTREKPGWPPRGPKPPDLPFRSGIALPPRWARTAFSLLLEKKGGSRGSLPHFEKTQLADRRAGHRRSGTRVRTNYTRLVREKAALPGRPAVHRVGSDGVGRDLPAYGG